MRVLLHFFCSIVGILCLGALPGLFEGLKINVFKYISTLKKLIATISEPSSITYGRSFRPLFPEIFIRYKESSIIFICAFLISILLALLIVYFLLSLDVNSVNRVKNFLLFLESIPDILIIFTLQLFFVWLFKKTNILFVQIAAAGDQKVRALPIISLSLPTAIMFIKLLLLRFETEFEKNYILLAKAKGLSKYSLFLHHVLKNVLLSLIFFSKTIIWYMLSCLFIIEYFYNSIGIFIFVKDYNTIEIFTITMLLIYIPVFLYFQLVKIILPKVLKEVM